MRMFRHRSSPQAFRKTLFYRACGGFVLFIILYSLTYNCSPSLQPPGQHIHYQRRANRTEYDDFWTTLEPHLRQAKPNCPRITASRYCDLDASFGTLPFQRFLADGACTRRDMTFRPGQHDKPRADHIHLAKESFDCLKASHQSMVFSAVALAASLPYARGTSGIVMVGGGRYDFLVLLSLRMLRATGSNLPVEVFVVSEAEYDAYLCNTLFPALNARCRFLSDILSASPHSLPLSEYQYKAFSILFSTFENVLFLDADAIVALPPDSLYTSEPFASTGLVTWPDLWAESSSPLFFKIARLDVPPIQRLSSDSGVILYSKAKHAASLLLATYYNYYGPDHYYPLLSQGAHGQGDKETYLHAAAALNMKFWDVKTPIWEIGQWLSASKFQRVGMGQHHPEDDFRLSAGDIYRKNHTVRPFVLHMNNPWKLVPSSIFKSSRHMAPTWHNGKRIRILGPEEEIMETFGYDFEASMWNELAVVACEMQIGCEEIAAHYDDVFGSKSVHRS